MINLNPSWRSFFYALSCFLFFSCSSYAQSNFRAGYVITNSGDTVRGFIDCKEWTVNPKRIKFKKEESSEEQTVHVGNSKGFKVEGVSAFKTYSVSISMNKIQFSSLSAFPDTTQIIDSVFLREEIMGENISLYSFRDALKTRFYYVSRGDDRAHELINKPYLSSTPGTTMAKNDKTYLRQLYKEATRYNVDISAFTKKVGDIDYNSKDLSKAVRSINGESHFRRPSPANSVVSKPKSFQLYAGGGLDFNVLTLIQLNSKGDAIFEASSDPGYGLYVKVGSELYLNRYVRKKGVRIEASYTTLNARVFNTSVFSTGREETTLEVRRSTVGFSGLIFQNLYNRPNLSVPFSLGIRGGYHDYQKSELNQKIYYFYQTSPANIDNTRQYDAYSFTFDIPTSLGVRLKRLEIFAAYNFQIATMDNNNMRTSLSLRNAQAGAVYYLMTNKEKR